MSGYNKRKRLIFLKDIFLLSVSSFGGAQMHMALFVKILVNKKKYLTETELLELYSLCHMLPGPSSTQTITGVGYKIGGVRLAFFSLLVWIMPATLLMTFFSLSYTLLDRKSIQIFEFLQPLAVAFIIQASFMMIRKSVSSNLGVFLAVTAFVFAALLRHPLEEYVKTPWIYPFILVGGGWISYLMHREIKPSSKKIKLRINYTYGIIFLAIFIGSALVGRLTHFKPVILFENTYRFGTLVFGGGNVLIPMMFEQYVKYKSFLNPDEFLTGVGLLQAIPGPVFSFSTFSTGLALKEMGMHWHLAGCLIGTAGIFLPGMLLIFFFYPIWSQIKHYSIIQRSLEGILAASAGLVAAGAYLLFLPVGLNWIKPDSFHYTNLNTADAINYPNVALVLILSVLLFRTKIPSPIWVLIAIVAGIFFS